MSDALRFFLDEEQVITALDFPVTGIDFVFMLNEKDWKTLTKEWESRSIQWKEGITYFAGFIELNQTSTILIKAIYETESLIVTQALFSIHQSITEELNETSKLSFTFNKKDKQKIIQELEYRKNDFDTFSELKELFLFLSAT